jgi:hypothetical protein
MTLKLNAGAALAAAVSAFLVYAPAVSAQEQGGPPPQQPNDQPRIEHPDIAPPPMRPQGMMGRSAPHQMVSSAPAENQQVHGQILDIRQVPVRGVRTQNVFVLIRTPQGNKVVVDLGDHVPGDLRQNQELAARGNVVEIRRQRAVLLADAYRYGGMTFDANRVAFAPHRFRHHHRGEARFGSSSGSNEEWNGSDR